MSNAFAMGGTNAVLASSRYEPVSCFLDDHHLQGGMRRPLCRCINEVRQAGSGMALVRRRSDWSGQRLTLGQRFEIA